MSKARDFAELLSSTGIFADGEVSASEVTNLHTVATSGSYNDLGDTPNLHTVATSGSYTDLSNTPSATALLTDIKTVDGASSGLDADLLDGIQASSFLRSDTNDHLNNVFDLDFITGNTYNYRPADNTASLALAPFSALVWHDVLAFDRYYSATQETYNGTSWSSVTLDKNLFAQKENQVRTIATGSTITKVRWNFTGTSWIQPQWLVIGFTYTNPTASKTVTVESSSDGGSTWTTRHQSNTSANGKVDYFKLTDWNGDADVRVTIDRNDTNDLKLSFISLLTARSGDQGKGKEAQVPFLWDADKNITLEGNLSTSGTIDGRDVAADGSKLDGIESGASADQTAAEILTEIKTVDGSGSGLDADLLDGQEGSYYTSYTDTAVANIVDSAPGTLNTLNELAAALGDDANFASTVSSQIGAKLDSSSYTASDVLTKIKTVDGSGSGLDADLLDGLQASQFLRSDAADTLTADLTVNKGSAKIRMGFNGGPHGIDFYDDDGSTLTWGFYYRTSPDTITFETGGNSTKWSLDTSGNVTQSGDLTVSGGDITLGGTGRIQGIDTVSAGTDAANKNYVDNAIATQSSGTSYATIVAFG